MPAKSVRVLDERAFALAARRVQPFVDYVAAVARSLARRRIISRGDAATLCLADDTAAWVCGRIAECNFATFRIASAGFDCAKARRALHAGGWQESCEQILWGAHSGVHCVYINADRFAGVAVRLVVWRGAGGVARSNPCPQLSYFVPVVSARVGKRRRYALNAGAVVTRDCDCLRRTGPGPAPHYVDLAFDLEDRDDANAYHKLFIVQEDLVEEPYDAGVVDISCSCLL